MGNQQSIILYPVFVPHQEFCAFAQATGHTAIVVRRAARLSGKTPSRARSTCANSYCKHSI
jgi:hypothetical protein